MRIYDPLPTNRRIRASLAGLVDYLLHSGFNYSGGETNSMAAAGGEECSWYEFALRTGRLDPRLRTVERWEEETARDGLFALDVEYIPAGKSVREVALRILREFNVRVPTPTCANDIARLVLNRTPAGATRCVPYPQSLWPTPT